MGARYRPTRPKHSALSLGHAVELEKRLKEEVARLLSMAEAADAEVPEGMDIPEELARREVRLEAIAEAKKKLGTACGRTVRGRTGRVWGQATEARKRTEGANLQEDPSQKRRSRACGIAIKSI